MLEPDIIEQLCLVLESPYKYFHSCGLNKQLRKKCEYHETLLTESATRNSNQIRRIRILDKQPDELWERIIQINFADSGRQS
ncbi:hypothetical protein RRF57_001959 [Xylaria bambusicola]|uniref:Uncharacterized protein n=1 Tax=Xylaria bambusicola TaxID=326684 RepID=A0AAN7UCB0_9PEZI